jgi:hypothetical protein
MGAYVPLGASSSAIRYRAACDKSEIIDARHAAAFDVALLGWLHPKSV